MKDVDYNQIDELCIPLVKFFNEVGLVTEYSCQGHDNEYQNRFHILFDNSVTDDDIYSFISRYSDECSHTPFVGEFVKWTRKLSGKIVGTWVYQVAFGNYLLNQKCAKLDEETFKNGRSTYEN